MRLSHSAIATAIAVALGATTVLPAHAQGVQAAAAATSIIGQVREASRGVALSGAIIRVGGQQVVTERDGTFRVTGLTPGSHRVVVDFLGYRSQEVDVTVPASGAARADITLFSTTTPEAGDLDRVQVRATRDAQALALNQQRSSTNYKNVVSADLLGQFPDNNIAESTQRIPGVSIERDQGEGRYVTVRGAPKEFTTVSLDGVQLANPDAASRGVELDTIPSDVIAALEVTKALTPDMDGDAIAGNINIRTQSALDRDRHIARLSLASGRFQLGDGANKRFNAAIGNRYGADKNIGVLISGSFSEQGRFTDNVETAYNGDLLPEVVEIKDYEGTRTRQGLTGRFDFRINPDHLVYFVANHSNFKDREFRDTLAIEFERHEDGADQTTGVAGRATFDKELRERTYNKTINTFNLAGEHFVGEDMRIDWQASHSKAEKETSPRDQFIFRSSVRPRMAYDYTDHDFPTWTILGVADAPATGVNLPESWYNFRRYNKRYEFTDETETGLRLDFTKGQDFLGSAGGDIRFGVRARMRDKSMDDNRFRNANSDDFDALGLTMSDMLCRNLGPSNNFDYFHTGGRFCRDIFVRHAPAMQNSADPDPGVQIEDSVIGDYTANEDVYGAYFRLDAHWDALTLVTGVRFESTRTEGTGYLFNTDTEEAVANNVSNSYDNWLPSAHVRYEFSEDSILRASYSTAINRPDFYNRVPYRITGDQPWSDVSLGNPDLKAAFAHNLDLSFEHYIRPLGLASAALFYKRIDDPIFPTRWSDQVTDDSETPPIQRTRWFTSYDNGGNGRIYGAELAWQQSFDFLPGFLNGFGMYANYTYAKSEAELPNNGGTTEMPGTSRHNYNLALSYEKYGLNTRLAYTYRSENIQEYDLENPDLNVLWDGRGSLDFTASYAITPNLRVFGEMNNITDTRQVRYQGARNRVLELEGFGRSWLLGVRYEY
ncbi:MAG: TonB-dependent receptor [Pseudoxanthomonas suwonensis]|nr:TonB-dependent receptor [Pseudoxanthomonas suwonensis]